MRPNPLIATLTLASVIVLMAAAYNNVINQVIDWMDNTNIPGTASSRWIT